MTHLDTSNTSYGQKKGRESNFKIHSFIFFPINIALIFVQIGFLIKNYGDQQNMNIKAHYEYFLLEKFSIE
jgi:hypothetical protein